MKIAVTGAGGLIGFHVLCRLQAEGFGELVPLSTADFQDPALLAEKLRGCEVVVHTAALNRGAPEAVEAENRSITDRLVAALGTAEKLKQIFFTSSVKRADDNAYGAMKRYAENKLAQVAATRGARFVNWILPHVFGEQGKAFSNSAVHTFCYQWAKNEPPAEVQATASLELLHAQDLAEEMVAAIRHPGAEERRVAGRAISVGETNERIRALAERYRSGVLPDLNDPLDLALFNTLRSFFYLQEPRLKIEERRDERGVLFEAVRTTGMGQAFVSWTEPGFTRGNHFHLRKIERFCVLEGEAEIQVRRLFSSETQTFRNQGRPLMLDIPTLHTHNIRNVGPRPLLTLFWANEIFDPERPDTYREVV